MCVCLFTDVCVFMYWVSMCGCVCLRVCITLVYTCSYNVLIISFQVNKEKKITSLTHFKVDVGCAAESLKVSASQWNLTNQIRVSCLSFNL